MISLTGVFRGVLGTFALSVMTDYLFRSHLLDAVGDVAKSVFDFFSQKEYIHITYLVLFLLDITILICG